jgi:hypothetical protein
VIKRKAIIEDDDDYLTNYGKTKIIEEDKNEEGNDKKKKFGKGNKNKKYNSDDTEITSDYKF